MEKLFTALLIIVFINVNAQYLNPNGEIKSGWIVENYDDDFNRASIGLETGKIYIQGDTIKAIKQLFAFIKQVTDEREQQAICIQKAVNFTNTVPDYFCKNKQWKVYQVELKKQGYKTVTIKKPKK